MLRNNLTRISPESPDHYLSKCAIMLTDANETVQVLQQFGISHAEITPINNGLINHTWLVIANGTKYTLQRVNGMFTPEIHQDIAAITAHLENNGVITPHLLQTIDNQLYVLHGEKIWRMYNYLEGITFNQVDEPDIAFQAGTVLARFHHGLVDMDYRFINTRTGVHDTPAHLQALQTALQDTKQHRRYADI